MYGKCKAFAIWLTTLKTGDSQYESASVWGHKQDWVTIRTGTTALHGQAVHFLPQVMQQHPWQVMAWRSETFPRRPWCSFFAVTHPLTHAFLRAGHANFHLFVSLHAMCSACPRAWCNCRQSTYLQTKDLFCFTLEFIHYANFTDLGVIGFSCMCGIVYSLWRPCVLN